MKIEIYLARQRLCLRDGAAIRLEFAVSSAARGGGEQNGSFCTPRGRHKVRAKIGAGAAPGTVFAGRRPTGEIYAPELGASFSQRDWILTRILWLSGLEPGRNRLGNVDTMRRYIYIHGTPDETRLGHPGSHGCIRMNNADIIELFDATPVGTEVDLHE